MFIPVGLHLCLPLTAGTWCNQPVTRWPAGPPEVVLNPREPRLWPQGKWRWAGIWGQEGLWRLLSLDIWGKEGLWDDPGWSPVSWDEKRFPGRCIRWRCAQLDARDTAKGQGSRLWHQCGFSQETAADFVWWGLGAGRSMNHRPWHHHSLLNTSVIHREIG